MECLEMSAKERCRLEVLSRVKRCELSLVNGHATDALNPGPPPGDNAHKRASPGGNSDVITPPPTDRRAQKLP